MMVTTVKRYLHSEEDQFSDLWSPQAPQQEVYHYALYEVCIELEVDLETGKSRIVGVDGHSVANTQFR